MRDYPTFDFITYLLVSTKGVGAVLSSYIILLKRNKVDTSRAPHAGIVPTIELLAALSSPLAIGQQAPFAWSP